MDELKLQTTQKPRPMPKYTKPPKAEGDVSLTELDFFLRQIKQLEKDYPELCKVYFKST